MTILPSRIQSMLWGMASVDPTVRPLRSACPVARCPCALWWTDGRSALKARSVAANKPLGSPHALWLCDCNQSCSSHHGQLLLVNTQRACPGNKKRAWAEGHAGCTNAPLTTRQQPAVLKPTEGRRIPAKQRRPRPTAPSEHDHNTRRRAHRAPRAKRSARAVASGASTAATGRWGRKPQELATASGN